MDWKNDEENTEEVSDDGAFNPPVSSPLVSSLYIYGAMTAIGGMVCHHVHHNLLTILNPDRFAALAPMQGMGLIGCAVALILIMSFFFHDLFEDFRSLRVMMMQMLGSFSLPSLLFLSVLSSIGEEILFRGAIQPAAGLFPTALFFGLVHLGPSLRLSSWSLWAFLAGLLLGWLFDATGSLFSPMIVHFTVNMIMMVYLKFLHSQGGHNGSERIQPSENGEG